MMQAISHKMMTSDTWKEAWSWTPGELGWEQGFESCELISVLFHFSIAVTIMTKGSMEKKGFILIYGSRRRFMMVGEALYDTAE